MKPLLDVGLRNWAACLSCTALTIGIHAIDMLSRASQEPDICSPCAGVIVSGIALVLSCCLREAVQLTDSLKTPGKTGSVMDEEEPLIQV